MKYLSRRQFMRLGYLAGVTLVHPSAVFSSDSPKSPQMYPLTISTLNNAYKQEMDAHTSYVAFSRKAAADKYPNIAYLFTTFATSEQIHAGLFGKTLADLGVTVDYDHDRQVGIVSTRENLSKAAKHEIELIEIFYPQSIDKIKPEKQDLAITYCRYAWQSHMQHRQHLEDIKRWSGLFFDRVAATIEAEHMQFVVCSFCGSTESEIPKKTCPICLQSSDRYRPVKRTDFSD